LCSSTVGEKKIKNLSKACQETGVKVQETIRKGVRQLNNLRQLALNNEKEKREKVEKGWKPCRHEGKGFSVIKGVSTKKERKKGKGKKGEGRFLVQTREPSARSVAEWSPEPTVSPLEGGTDEKMRKGQNRECLKEEVKKDQSHAIKKNQRRRNRSRRGKISEIQLRRPDGSALGELKEQTAAEKNDGAREEENILC